jgi:hypothetical protein
LAHSSIPAKAGVAFCCRGKTSALSGFAGLQKILIISQEYADKLFL